MDVRSMVFAGYLLSAGEGCWLRVLAGNALYGDHDASTNQEQTDKVLNNSITPNKKKIKPSTIKIKQLNFDIYIYIYK